jgi:hypothetical protein
MDSIANTHLNDDPGAIITFPDETFGLSGLCCVVVKKL